MMNGNGLSHDEVVIDRASGDLVTMLPSIGVDSALIDAVEIFQNAPTLRLLPVLDAQDAPLGALFERDIRSILFNPFGHALLKNPSFGSSLGDLVQPCPVVASSVPTEVLIDIHGRQGQGCEGLIITHDGRYAGVVGSQILLRLAAERQARSARRRTARFERIEEACRQFRTEAVRLTTDLAQVADELALAARTMADTAGGNSRKSADVAIAASQASSNMGAIASRGKALAAMLTGMEQSINNAGSATDVAVARADKAAEQTRFLADAADEIGDVTALIDGIARKTSMLALNATIEAARAGQAGLGFTVVASEVKSLAAQTREAAAGITRRIDHIRTAIADVSIGHDQIGHAIAAVETLSGSVFHAVSQHADATRAIATNVDEARGATDHIHSTAEAMNRNAAATAAEAQAILSFSTQLSDGAQDFQKRLSHFLNVILTA